MCRMPRKFKQVLIVLALAAAVAAACSTTNSGEPGVSDSEAASSPPPAATPSNQLTEADVAKLRWLEGSWRGMDGQKPFFERIHFEGTTMIVETFSDETLSKAGDRARFELKDGEFGHTVGDQRSAASFITDDSVQFVAAPPQPGAHPKGSTFRFERQPDGTWNAILTSNASPGRAASEKVYHMEPLGAPAR